MPTRRTRLTRVERAEYRAMSSKLENMHIDIPILGNFEPKPQRFLLTQVDTEFARIHDLPDRSMAVTLGAKLTILTAGVIFTDAQVLPQWDEWPLDLGAPREHRYFNHLIEDFLELKPTILNDMLVDRALPLRTCQLKGVIIATGWTQVPANYPNEKALSFELLLRDEQGSEFSFPFIARVDRRLKHQYERRRPDPRVVAERLKNRVSLFDRDGSEAGIHLSPSSPSISEDKEGVSTPDKHRDTT